MDDDEQHIIEVGAVIAQDEHSVTVFGVGMSDADAVALVIAYAQAVQRVKGMTRQ